MLFWPKGRRESDGIWAEHWYKNVENSTGFNSYNPKKIKLEKKYKQILDECYSIYSELNRYKIKVNHLEYVNT